MGINKPTIVPLIRPAIKALFSGVGGHWGAGFSPSIPMIFSMSFFEPKGRQGRNGCVKTSGVHVHVSIIKED